MAIGENIQYMRKLKGLTQEELADRLKVSRQTVSKWEMNQAYPEIPKLRELAALFFCKVDDLLSDRPILSNDIYSDVVIREIPGFRLGRYVMISPNPEDDIHAWLDRWAQESGLNDFTDGNPQRIGWDFPFVSLEQQNRFGLHGYVEGWILPDGFIPKCGGVEYCEQGPARYACITIRDPFSRAFETIPGGYKRVIDYLGANGFKEKVDENVISCFEHVSVKDGVTYMTVCLYVDSVASGNLYTPFHHVS